MTPKSTLSKFATSMKGSPLTTGEAFSFSKYIGQKGNVIIELTDSGSSRVASFMPTRTEEVCRF